MGRRVVSSVPKASTLARKCLPPTLQDATDWTPEACACAGSTRGVVAGSACGVTEEEEEEEEEEDEEEEESDFKEDEDFIEEVDFIEEEEEEDFIE